MDLLRQFKDKVRVSMTVETDREDIRKYFTPYAPPIPARLKTLQQLAEFDIPTQVAIAPVLPSSEHFAEILRPLVNRVCIDDYFMGTEAVGNEHIGWVYKPYIAIWKWKIGTIRPSIKWFINECGSIFRKMNFSLARRVSNLSVIALIRRRHHSTEWKPSIFNLKTTIILYFIFI